MASGEAARSPHTGPCRRLNLCVSVSTVGGKDSQLLSHKKWEEKTQYFVLLDVLHFSPI